ncbi:hypothetical protein METBIDRAFT_37141 [Metschnikowia bicuspidata var. bicuspidata NRRL YB-4993]|uniref:C2H2-type domain-containing protein n=1 Tax=Metschnikowia bicuspidata var. bicuspidata NRRL YB-4993 TaxID=869754 RepID=A0A1A0HG76_9ASCO|nr:hypothetical protein METBIDRAFT_37141 [Metschnikowia bicuspidata var. bicuspidata NRRL YB-4993]OBA23169.1 hypothetical protein METBIDRAFT_37141 [Metschnikowia bicuspidata var. bicuspidata NRRL YB-4993]
MGKADFGSAKYQAKQLKALGLQKLRYYCQLCLKQCRDANGFKNHLASPSHTGRISNLSTAGRAQDVIAQYLLQFEAEFLRLLRVNHGTKKISANKFYQEYILHDKDHVHMNATRWSSLTAFIKHLGQSSKVRVEIPEDADDEFNLFIRLVDLPLETLDGHRARALQTEEERLMKFLDAQIEKGKQLQSEAAPSPEPAPVVPVATGPVAISLRGVRMKKPPKKLAFGSQSDDDDE